MMGPLLVALPCLLAALLGFNTYAPDGADAALGIAVGAAAVVAMAQTLILAARPPLVEPLFGGLDRMYRVHKWLGISAMVLMILHQQIEPDFERTVRETGLGELGAEAGELAFNALLALIAVSCNASQHIRHRRSRCVDLYRVGRPAAAASGVHRERDQPDR
jgi:hypothetical protein